MVYAPYVEVTSCAVGAQRGETECRRWMGSTGPSGSTNLSCNLSHQPVGVLEQICFSDLLFSCLVNAYFLYDQSETNRSKQDFRQAAHFTFSVPHSSDKLTVLGIQTGDLTHLSSTTFCNFELSWDLLLLLNVIYRNPLLYFVLFSFYRKWTIVTSIGKNKKQLQRFGFSLHCFS